jgi:hypothetical protein
MSCRRIASKGKGFDRSETSARHKNVPESRDLPNHATAPVAVFCFLRDNVFMLGRALFHTRARIMESINRNHKVVIVGAGPAGSYFVLWRGKVGQARAHSLIG